MQQITESFRKVKKNAFSVCVFVDISDSARMTSLLLWRHAKAVALQRHLGVMWQGVSLFAVSFIF